MSEAASSRPLSPVRRRFWKTIGSEPRDASPPSSVTRLPRMHRLGARGERLMGFVTERRGCSESSSGMDKEGGRWRAAREERCDSEGRDTTESLELKRDSLAVEEAVDVGASPMERALAARGRSGEDGLRMLGPGRGSWRSPGPTERAEALRLSVEAAVV